MDSHFIELRPDGWSLTCPPECDDACAVRAAVREQLRSPPCLGRHPLHLEDGRPVVECDRNVWLSTDKLSLPGSGMTDRIDRHPRFDDPGAGVGHPGDGRPGTRITSGDDHKALTRDGFHPWR